MVGRRERIADNVDQVRWIMIWYKIIDPDLFCVRVDLFLDIMTYDWPMALGANRNRRFFIPHGPMVVWTAGIFYKNKRIRYSLSKYKHTRWRKNTAKNFIWITLIVNVKLLRWPIKGWTVFGVTKVVLCWPSETIAVKRSWWKWTTGSWLQERMTRRCWPQWVSFDAIIFLCRTIFKVFLFSDTSTTDVWPGN